MTELKSNHIYDVIILGGGPAGLTAGIYTSRAMLDTLIFAGNPPGGQLTTTTEVENFPGFPEGIQGPELVQKIRTQAEKFGAQIVDQNVASVSGDYSTGFEVTTATGAIAKARTLIIATGASARWLGLESEARLKGRGVSACATCDGFFYKDKIVAVVGAGDAAMEEATFLTKFASRVHVLSREAKDEMVASKIMQEKAFDNNKIEFHFNTEVVEILGEDKVSGVKVINNKTQEISVIPDVEGVFVAIGHVPNTKFLEGFVELDARGFVSTPDGTHTSKEGVFVAGDVADPHYQQAITASAGGCKAALDTEAFLSKAK